MPKISSDVFVAVPPSRAFEAIGSFADASWVPGTARVEVSGHGVGAVRTLTTVDGAQIKERLESYDANARRYSYSIVEAPMPIADYLSTVEVHAEGTGARVRWSATFDADAGVQSALQGLFDSAMKGLAKRFG